MDYHAVDGPPQIVHRAILGPPGPRTVYRAVDLAETDEKETKMKLKMEKVVKTKFVFVHIEDLLLELEKQGIVCYWNKHFVGAVC